MGQIRITPGRAGRPLEKAQSPVANPLGVRYA
jgi:hypothetical protein